MSGWIRFWYGGVGALLPMLVTLLGLDLSTIIDHGSQLTLGMYVGAGLRYIILFVLGGGVAFLNSDEIKPLKLIQLGIAAPALISSLVNAQQPSAKSQLEQPVPKVELFVPDVDQPFGVVNSAYATEFVQKLDVHLPTIVQHADFLGDIGRSIVQPLQAPPPLPSPAPVQPPALESQPAEAKPPSLPPSPNTSPAAEVPLEHPSAPTAGSSIAPESSHTTDIQSNKPAALVAMIRRAQQYLIALGYDVDQVTGQTDAKTLSALRAFKNQHGLPTNDDVDTQVLQAMKVAITTQPEPSAALPP